MPHQPQEFPNEPSLWSVGPPPQKATSRLAGDAAALTTTKRYRQIIALLQERGPMTLFEFCAAMHKTPNQISGRLTELCRALVIERTGERRPNPATGCMADVYRLQDGHDSA